MVRVTEKGPLESSLVCQKHSTSCRVSAAGVPSDDKISQMGQALKSTPTRHRPRCFLNRGSSLLSHSLTAEVMHRLAGQGG